MSFLINDKRASLVVRKKKETERKREKEERLAWRGEGAFGEGTWSLAGKLEKKKRRMRRTESVKTDRERERGGGCERQR